MPRTEVTDYDRLIEIIFFNLLDKPCFKDFSIGGGCFAECDDCAKERIFQKIKQRLSQDSILNATHEELEKIIIKESERSWNDWISPDDIGPTKEDMILLLRGYYSTIDFGDDWDDYIDCDLINELHENGKSSLHIKVEEFIKATDFEKEEIRQEIKDLIDDGIDVEIRDNSGYTAWEVAILEQEEELAEFIDFLKNRPSRFPPELI